MKSIALPTLLLALATPAAAQPARAGGPAAPVVVSPEVSGDHRITVRLYAPKAEAVRLDASDVPGVPLGAGAPMTKAENGVWQVTLGPVPAGAYRYAFVVDGVPTLDPRNPATSEANTNAWSLVYVPGSDLFDTRPVPRGAVAEVTYYSDSLGMFRRMHVYTPPGYDAKSDKYPVLYLLHGAGDDDSAWSTIGRAGFILDNLIAAKKAKPMIVVMPSGNLPFPGMGKVDPLLDRFTNDLLKDVVPHVEKQFRVKTGAKNRALAGVSMGGAQTMHVLATYPERFGYVALWSASMFGGDRNPAAFEQQYEAFLKNAEAVNKSVKLLEITVGEEDRILNASKAMSGVFKKHGVKHQLKVTGGSHTWINWHRYLNELAPKLFQ